MKKKILSIILVLVLGLTLLAGCGGGATEEAASQDDFLLGSWFADTATVGGETVDAQEVFGGVLQLYFNENGECTMSIDDQRAVVRWERTDDGVLLTGDDTYSITFPDGSQTTMIAVIRGVDVLLEKYEEAS